jgi:glycosyltransferase involved in cell wall biosynthesis
MAWLRSRLVIDVVLPALNEATAVPAVLRSIPDGFHPIVVDNGSTDSTAETAARCGAHVVVESRQGFGAACLAGLQAATTDVVCFMDCDASLDGAELVRITDPVTRGEADLVLGAREATGRGAWPVHAHVANRLLARLVSRRWNLALSDLGPMRAAHRPALLGLGLADSRFGFPLEMVVRAAERGWAIAEVPVSYHRRVGRSKVTGTVLGTLRCARDMTKVLR